MPRLLLLAGCNGAGKSTLATRVLIPISGLPFINADLMAEERWPGDREAQSRQAHTVSRLAAEARDEMLKARQSFITETVFSHPSKLELLVNAQRLGYTVDLHVVMIPEDLAVERVLDRTAAGGHQVPEDKVRERHRRLWRFVADAIRRADSATVYDNSMRAAPLKIVAFFENGQATTPSRWPAWTPADLVSLTES